MKDFFKWLGVNEKIAKIVVWLFIFAAFLIVTNTMLESIGLPYYKLTVDNLSKINYPKALEYLLNWIIILLNFYSMIFLVFRVKEFKKIFKWSILYLMLNVLISVLFGNIVGNVFIFLFFISFCFFYSGRKWKYALYAISSYVIGVFVQYICYLYKIKFVDYANLNYLNRFVISLDFFIIMFVVILVKEIILKKKGEIKE